MFARLSALLIAAAAAPTTFAADSTEGPWYVGLSGSYTVSGDDISITPAPVSFTQSSGATGLAILGGYTFHTQGKWSFRAEGELSRDTLQVDGYASAPGAPAGEITLTNFGANGYADFALSQGWSLYGGAGLLLVFSDANLAVGGPSAMGGTDTTWAWQVRLGADYAIKPGVHVIAGYRYRAFGDIEAEIGSTTYTLGDAATHSLEIGLRISL